MGIIPVHISVLKSVSCTGTYNALIHKDIDSDTETDSDSSQTHILRPTRVKRRKLIIIALKGAV